MNLIVKKALGHVCVIAFFMVLICIYFSPSIFDDKTLQQSDMQQATGMAQELKEYKEKEGKISAWTGSMFSGMPAYHIYSAEQHPNYLVYIEKPAKSIDYIGGSIIFIALVCFYILMCTMGVNRWLAIAGSIAFAFASYNLIIIVAGHVTKAYVIAYMPLVIVGMVLLFKQKWLWGAAMFTLGIALSVMNGHIQITYYLAIFCVFFFLGYLAKGIQEKRYVDLAKVTGVMVACLLLAVLPNLGNLYSNYEVAKDSTRGPSELTATTTGSEEKASGGLDKDYAFSFSYGKGELLTLLIPNVYGGETGGRLDKDYAFYKEWKALGQQAGKEVQAPTYWGDLPFTSGPVYFGALVCLLFVLGMFVIKNPIKWWIAGGSLFFVFLALGRHLDWFNDIMFHYLPMYNKFRTPSMALVIPGMVFPIIGIWGLKDIFTQKANAASVKKGLIWSLSIVGGICLLVWLIPGLFLNFKSVQDAQLQQWPAQLYDALVQDRRSLASSDAFRSLIFILLGGGLLYYFLIAKNKNITAMIVGISIAVLILVDLWTVDKRYLNDGSFSKEKLAETFKKSPADEFILNDKSPSYRVLNLNNPFQETNTSYFHKSIGGYHAVKLRRYQELIDHRLMNEVSGNILATLQKARTLDDILPSLEQCKSLNMLNAKYIVYSPEQPPIVNPYAYGNAWFAREVKMMENADQEISSLNEIDPLRTVVIDKRFADQLSGLNIVTDSMASIVLETYKPDQLTYKSKALTEQFAVFSEIYYEEGWKAYIDGQQVPYSRVDWTLRGMRIPAGEHTVEFKFIPEKYNRAVMISSVSSGIILVLLFVAVGFFFFGKNKKKEPV